MTGGDAFTTFYSCIYYPRQRHPFNVHSSLSLSHSLSLAHSLSLYIYIYMCVCVCYFEDSRVILDMARLWSPSPPTLRQHAQATRCRSYRYCLEGYERELLRPCAGIHTDITPYVYNIHAQAHVNTRSSLTHIHARTHSQLQGGYFRTEPWLWPPSPANSGWASFRSMPHPEERTAAQGAAPYVSCGSQPAGAAACACAGLPV